MAELRRIQAGVFSENSMHTLYEFQDALTKYKNGDNKFLNSMIIPAEEIIKKVFPIIQVKPSCINNMKTGKKMILADLVDKKLFNSLKENDIFAIFCDEEFLEIAQKCKTRDYIARSLFVYN
jgi:tRNA U55 pseudouridine synthase TruB